MNIEINRLINYGLQKGLLDVEDVDYVVNALLDVLQETSYQKVIINETLPTVTPILEKLLEKSIHKGIIEDTMMSRDLFDTRIMGCLSPRPSSVNTIFKNHYQVSPKQATDYFYQLSIASNYIRKDRTDKDISFTRFYKYANIEITINLSKPDKDPKDIEKAKTEISSDYPKCLLCKENVGFIGNMNVPARQNHRIIPLTLDHQRYYLQYSPYVYYNEHCIVLNGQHIPMVINEETLSHLLSFVEQFPHYMIGSNADLPIVGGSILAHDHFQGGCHTFPIEEATVIKSYVYKKYSQVQIDILHWPLSTIRLTSQSKTECLSLANAVLLFWKDYSNPKVDIVAYTNQRHNTITSIVRKKGTVFQMDLVLRNNRTSEQYPDGIFHPHSQYHHIKKENIGLIEVMGLAILPARLKTEVALLKDCLLKEKEFSDYEELQKHQTWFTNIQEEYDYNKDTIDNILEQELTRIFVCVLEDAGVFKMNDIGVQAFTTFMKEMEEAI
jgi:UDPglucose--hexose-1-phosphate uridylyltransferase